MAPASHKDSALTQPPRLRAPFQTQFRRLPLPRPQPQAPPQPHPPRTCHADAGELAYAVEARGLVAAGPG